MPTKTRWSEKNSILDLKFRSWNYDQSTASVFEVCAFFFFARCLLDFSFRLFSTWNDLVLFSFMPAFSSISKFWLFRLNEAKEVGSCSMADIFGFKLDLDLGIIWFRVSTSFKLVPTQNSRPNFRFQYLLAMMCFRFILRTKFQRRVKCRRKKVDQEEREAKWKTDSTFAFYRLEKQFFDCWSLVIFSWLTKSKT